MKKLLYAIILAGSIAHADGEKSFAITNFTGGLNSNYSSLTIADDEVQDVLNMWFDEDNSLVKRNGYTTYGTTGTFRFTNGWKYTDSSNNNWIVVLSSDAIRASKGTGVFTVKIATVPAPATSLVGAVNAFGKIYFVDLVQGVYSWDGTQTAKPAVFLTGSPLGELITEFKGRLWVAGKAHPNQNELSSSEYLDATNWATGSLATDPVTYIVGLTDKSDGITGLFSGLNDAIYIPKKDSMHALYGFDQDDFQVRVLTSEYGCIDAGTIQPFAGGILCLSKRGFDLFDGVSWNPVSKKILNRLQPALYSSFSQKSWTLTSEDEFNDGSGTPTGWTSTTISPGTVVLGTDAAHADFVDTSSANFSAGTLVNLSTITTANSLTLKTWATIPTDITQDTGGPPYDCNFENCNDAPWEGLPVAQSFVAPSTPCYIHSISVYLNSAPGASLGFAIRSTVGGANLASGSIANGTGWKEAHLSTPYYATPGATYWIYMPGDPDHCTIFDSVTGNPYAGGYAWYDGAACAADDLRFRVDFTSATFYYSTGTILSRTFDVGITTASWLWSWGALTGGASKPAGTNIIYQTQTSSASPATTWTTLTSTFASGGNVSSTVKRYLRYKATLTTTDTITKTPTLNDVTISMSEKRRPYGTYISPIYNIGSGIASFGSFDATFDLGSGSINFAVCVSTFAAFTKSTCTVQTVNAQITATPKAYIQYRATFTITAATQAPILYNTTVKWNEGTRRPRMTSVIYKDRYWVSLATNSLSNNNDATFVLSKGAANNKLNWTEFNIGAGAFIIYKDELYHADAYPSGRVYLDNQGYSDAGAAINAFVKTKDYALDGVMNDKLYKEFWLLADALGAYNINTTYYLDRESTEYSLSSVLANEQVGFISLKLPFPFDADHQVFGRSIAFKFQNDELNAPMRLYGGNLIYKMRPIQ